jgi:hypothetical protein
MSNKRQASSPAWMLTNYDCETTLPSDLETEMKRLTILRTFPLLHDTDAKTAPDYEMLAELAMSLLSSHMACVKLVDLAVIRVVASTGSWPTMLTEIQRRDSFCGHTIQIKDKQGVFVVPDTLQDDRFTQFPQVTGPPYVRFYAGAPLITSEGARLGSICVMDTEPRPQGLAEEEREQLLELATLVVDMMEQARQDNKNCSSMDNKQLQDSHEQQPTESSPLHIRSTLSKSLSMNSLEASLDSASTSELPHKTRRPHGSMADLKSPHSFHNEPIQLMAFVRGLKIALQSFPLQKEQVDLQFVMDSSCPVKFIVSDDLMVFRAAVAVLTHACERTSSGYIRLTVCANEDRNQMIFTCQDTGPNLSDDPFQASLVELLPSAADQCLLVDPQTGKAMGGVCRPPSQDDHTSVEHYSLHAVVDYMSKLNGRYGYEPRSKTDNEDDATGAVVWFSVPIRTVP